MRKLFIIAGLSGVLALTACSSDDGSDKVVESDAGDITKQELYDQMKGKAGSSVLQDMVTMTVLDDKYDVSDEMVDKEVESTKDELGDQFDMFLQQQGLEDEDAFRRTIRLSLLQLEAAAEDMDISKEDLKQRYDRMQTEIEAKHILVDDKETAKEVKSKLDNGKDFTKLVEEYSQDKGNQKGMPPQAQKGKDKKNDGNLGYFTAGDMEPAFEDAAYNMDVGEISDPVETDKGFHIIKVTDKRDVDEDIGSFEDNKQKIRRDIITQRADMQQLKEKVNNLIDEADVDVKDEDLKGIFDQDKKQKSQSQG